MNPETMPLLDAYHACLELPITTERQAEFRTQVLMGIEKLAQLEDLLDAACTDCPEEEL